MTEKVNSSHGSNHPLIDDSYIKQQPTSHQRGAFKTTRGFSYHVRPVGKQHKGLYSVTDGALNIKRNKIFRNNRTIRKNQFSKIEKNKSKANIPSLRTIAKYVHTSALHTVNSLHLGSIIKHGVTITNKNFARSFKLLRGIGVATQGIDLTQQTGREAAKIISDVRMHKKRTQAQALLSKYDPEHGRVEGDTPGQAKLNKLHILLAEKEGELARTKKQTAFDHILKIKNIFITASGLIESSLLLAARFTSVVGPALPGVGAVVSGIAFIKSTITTGTQIAALNNLASAKASTSDPLLQALAGHIKKERTTAARQGLTNTAISAVSAASNIGAVAAGPGALVGAIVAGGLGIGSAIGMQAYNSVHTKRLNKQRQLASVKAEKQLTSLDAKKNIGVAERLFLDRLRYGKGEPLKESVRFLRNLGVTDTTIKRLQLSPEKSAQKLLLKVLYQEKLSYKGLMLKQTGKTFLHVTGANALHRRIKSGSKWLAQRLQHRTKLSEALVSQPEKKIVKAFSFRAPSTLFTDYLKKRQGYSLLKE